MTIKIDHLKKVEFFTDLNPQELAELAEDFQWEEYAPGIDIIRQGQERHRFYVLTEGQAEAVVSKEESSDLKVCVFGPGDAFGELSMFSGKPTTTIIRSVVKCKLLMMDAEHFARMLVRWPKLYHRFLEKISSRLNHVNTGLWEAKHKEFLRSGLQLNQLEHKFYGVWGSPKTTREVEGKLTELAQLGQHLLIIGERGTGRQMLAWYLHKQRFGETAPFIVVDSGHFDQQWGDIMFEPRDRKGSLPLIKGKGLLDLAEGGTLFIREINLISPRAQTKLATAMQSSSTNCLIIGSLIAEPHQLPARIDPEFFKYFTQSYKITPLRERKRDIAVIANGVLEKLARQHNRKTPILDKEAIKLLLSHNYRQGNVSELIQVVERAFFLTEEDIIGLEHVFFGPPAEKIGRSINLLSWNALDNLFKNGSLLLGVRLVSAIIFMALILLMLLAPATNTAAFVFIFVWGLWWPALTVISPLLGRVWCTICPFSFIMNLIQKYIHRDLPVPNVLKQYDYLFVTFLFLLILWVEAVGGLRYNMVYTGILLLVILTAAIITGIIFTRHAWCHHLCPLGGFVGMASIGGMIEVRSDATVCLNKCTTFECYRGHGDVPGCPMSQHLPYIDNNMSCKLCMNCVRNCPNGAVKVNLRIPAREVWHLVRVNQGYAVFIGASLSILAPIIYFEPFHWVWPWEQWFLWFSLAYWGSALTAGFITWFITRPFQTKATSRRIKLAFAFIPLVLAGYIIYHLRYIPGADSITIGFSFKSFTGNTQSIYVPALLASQVLTAFIGIFLSGVTSFMVFLRDKPKAKTLLEVTPKATQNF
ncbi:MAG: cyclic nucleotide-binding domain-containing protein [Thermincolia bacterium]